MQEMTQVGVSGGVSRDFRAVFGVVSRKGRAKSKRGIDRIAEQGEREAKAYPLRRRPAGATCER